jgi:DNA invertase Pin-like site-specific DNA recombinase
VTAYAYLRKSSVQNSTDLAAHAQEHAIRELANRHGDNDDSLVVLSDLDVSGQQQSIGRRKGYRALVEAVESGACTAVYSYSLSRLARSVAELDRFFDLCVRHAVPVRLVADAVDTATASGRLTMHVLSSVAQFEAEVASERIRSRMALKRAKGERLGGIPYGDQPSENVQLVVNAFTKAGSFTGAARLLNQQRIKPRRADMWRAGSVAEIMRRVDPSIRPGKGAKHGYDFMFSRLLACGVCGTLLSGYAYRNKPNQPVRYACSRAQYEAHPRRSISEIALLPAMQALAARWQPPQTVWGSTIGGDAAKQSELDAKRERILDMFADGLIDKTERERRLQPIHAALSQLESFRVLLAVPALDWSWPPRDINRVLRAMFNRIGLHRQTFQPVRPVTRLDEPAWMDALNVGAKNDALRWAEEDVDRS